MTIFVLDINGNPLMPTNRNGKVRHLLKDGKAIIYKHNPFTIQLTYETDTYTQPIDANIDTGYQHVGISIKSESEEYVSAEYELLSDEKQNHDDCRKYRRTRRNRKRYRKPRFNNRKSTKPEGWLAPSLKNKADRHVDIIKKYAEVCPITDIYVEIGQFDTQVLQAFEEGKPIPEGKDYQQGQQYGIDTLREAVFQRDNYTCIFCGRSAIKDKAILHLHHAYYWMDRHGNRMDELATACECCHTPANHQKTGKLWGYDKKMKTFTGAAFMNTIRYYIVDELKKAFLNINIHTTYGSITKRTRLNLGLEKTHANDAYSMGKFRPVIRPETEYYKKKRRNNRCLEKFYDAKYIDIRDHKKKAGKELGCERTNRRELRNSEKSLRQYHGEKTSKGHRTIRKQRYELQPHDVVLFENKKYTVIGTQNNGDYVKLNNKKVISIKKVKLIKHCSGYYKK